MWAIVGYRLLGRHSGPNSHQAGQPRSRRGVEVEKVPVWSHDGIICTGEKYKNVVKMTLRQGRLVEGPFAPLQLQLRGPRLVGSTSVSGDCFGRANAASIGAFFNFFSLGHAAGRAPATHIHTRPVAGRHIGINGPQQHHPAIE